MRKFLIELGLVFAFLLYSPPLHAEEKSFDILELDRLCSKVVRPFSDKNCEQFNREYWWGNKLPEVERLVNEASELIRRAVITGRLEDYKKIENYMSKSKPVEFSISEHIDGKIRRHSLKINNIKEFASLFNRINQRTYTLTLLKERPYSPRYHSHSSVTLYHSYSTWLSVICDGQEDLKLPEKRHLCNSISIRIDTICFED
jgi:hypothetical protein